MKLHEDNELFKNALLATAQQIGLPVGYVEKDYWITLALYTIFQSAIGSEAVFKGGTALSKCFQLIERFSEDIDIAVTRNEGETNSQMDKKVAKVSKSIITVLPEIVIEDITKIGGKTRKTVHNYEKVFDGDLGQVRDKLILEVTWLGYFEPYMTTMVQSYVSDMMKANNQTELIETYQLQPFQVKVLKTERTLCEKIMSLVRFSFTKDPISDLNKKVRHIYDIHKLLQDEVINQFFKSNAFEDMLVKVATDDIESFKNNNAWLANHPKTAIIFSDMLNTWNQINQTYNSTFKTLVFGELPSEKDILDTLHEVANRLKSIKWTIKTNY